MPPENNSFYEVVAVGIFCGTVVAVIAIYAIYSYKVQALHYRDRKPKKRTTSDVTSKYRRFYRPEKQTFPEPFKGHPRKEKPETTTKPSQS